MTFDWSRAFNDASVFERERAMLENTWTFLGLTRDLAVENAWLRASIGGRSVFVQRFGDELRGFENACAHRGHPIRNGDRGKGDIVCPFHAWRYNRDGLALGVPMCKEYFETTPRELDARLESIEIATCGDFIFGRFAPPGGGETLELFLGILFPILRAMSAKSDRARTSTHAIEANWKHCYHITLDDYHTVAVHPETFGKSGYLPRDRVAYYRVGEHSAYFYSDDPAARDPDELAAMASACALGTERETSFRIFNVFPNLVVAHSEIDWRFWYVCVTRYSPSAVDRTRADAWIYPSPFPARRTGVRRRLAGLTEIFRPFVVEKLTRWIMRQDRIVCENLQKAPPPSGREPRLGAHEQRIQWFNEVYRARMERAGGKATGISTPPCGTP
jgi:phenylpropionate dioxygenase-like ring-hydroxylating dioxygenase large terminal subunit